MLSSFGSAEDCPLGVPEHFCLLGEGMSNVKSSSSGSSFFVAFIANPDELSPAQKPWRGASDRVNDTLYMREMNTERKTVEGDGRIDGYLNKG